jgi:hypothetical protein
MNYPETIILILTKGYLIVNKKQPLFNLFFEWLFKKLLSKKKMKDKYNSKINNNSNFI